MSQAFKHSLRSQDSSFRPTIKRFAVRRSQANGHWRPFRQMIFIRGMHRLYIIYSILKALLASGCPGGHPIQFRRQPPFSKMATENRKLFSYSVIGIANASGELTANRGRAAEHTPIGFLDPEILAPAE
jgi:hypothetical protein